MEFQSALSVNGQEAKSNVLKVYPNPANSFLRIEGQEGELVKVYTMSGSLVIEVNNTNEVNVEHLSPGIYAVVVQNQQVIYQSKFIKD